MPEPSYITIAGRAEAEIIEKKSRFVASVAHVETEEEALAFIEEIKVANRMARHNVYAYVIREGGRVRYTDDGEPQKTAGMPTLDVITHAGLTDIVVVTTRYFGGILLGTGGLVRAYTEAAQAGIRASEIVTVSRCIEVSLSVPYSLYEQAVRIAEECEANVVQSDFADDVTLVFRMLERSQTALTVRLTELTRGQALITSSEPFDAVF